MNAIARTDASTLLAWVERSLEACPPEPDICALVVPVPPLREARLFSQATDQAVFWQPSPERTVVGLGSVIDLTGEGASRFAQVRSQADACRALVQPWPGSPPVVLRWFGGFAFAPGQSRTPPWSEFGDARFTLPRFVYERDPERAWLVIAAGRAERSHPDGRRALLRELGALLGSTTDHRVAPPPPSNPQARELLETECNDYRERVEAIQHAIWQGDLSKVVAARRVVLRLSEPTEFSGLLERLRGQDETSTVFAFRFGAALFGGASPERLVRKRARELETEAVAGSAPTSPPDSAQGLLASSKNRLEHQMVVDSLHERLAPLCDRLTVPGSPQIRRLSRVLHLWTHLPGHLRAPIHVLELVERLHPSPAVGGLPAEKAFDWILRHEPHPRGWYAAPVGWFDQQGDGDFVVALRSGVFLEHCAYLYAGAGIVTRSDAEEELRETELKLSTLRTALGVESP